MRNYCYSRVGVINARRFAQEIMERNDNEWQNRMNTCPTRNHITNEAVIACVKIMSRAKTVSGNYSVNLINTYFHEF